MNEIFDRLLIRFFFAVFVCAMLLLYKYLHSFIYLNERKQILKSLFPADNAAHTLHFFSRLIGVCLIFSTLGFDESSGIFLSLFHFLVWGSLSFLIYMASIYIAESIVFSNFEYVDEVLKRKNLTYGIISFSQAISLALIVRTVVVESEGSLVILIMLWLLALVLFGFSTRLYKFVSKFSFNKLLIHKSISLGLSYSGFIIGCTIIISTAFEQEHYDIKSYGLQVFLRTILSVLLYPLFSRGLHFIFKIKDSIEETKGERHVDLDSPSLGLGIYEGAAFLSIALLTALIIGRIQFSTVYPFF